MLLRCYKRDFYRRSRGKFLILIPSITFSIQATYKSVEMAKRRKMQVFYAGTPPQMRSMVGRLIMLWLSVAANFSPVEERKELI